MSANYGQLQVDFLSLLDELERESLDHFANELHKIVHWYMAEANAQTITSQKPWLLASADIHNEFGTFNVIDWDKRMGGPGW